MTNRRFSTAGRTYQRQLFSGLDGQINIVQNFFAVIIGKIHPVKTNFAFHIFQLARIRALLFHRLIDQLVETLKTGHAILVLLHKVD